MADQVNPLGGLAPGMAQTPQVFTAVPSSPKPPIVRAAEARSKAEGSAESKSKAGGSVEFKAQDATQENLEAALKSVKEFLQQSPSDLRFGVDQDTGHYFFKIIDPVTQETIRQVPAKEILVMARRLRELSDSKDTSGVLMDEEG